MCGFCTINFISDYFALQQRNNLTIQVTSLSVDLDNSNARLEEEAEANSALRNQVSKLGADLAAQRSKFEKELMSRTEELEDLRYALWQIYDICARLFTALTTRLPWQPKQVI